MPMMGALVATRKTELSGLRKWRVRDFDNFLIFYFPREQSVDIMRVIYGSRDWIGILNEQQSATESGMERSSIWLAARQSNNARPLARLGKLISPHQMATLVLRA